MKRFNDGWSFLKTVLGTELKDITGREMEFDKVDIPHDWLIYNTGDLYEDGTGWYRKVFTVAEEALGDAGNVTVKKPGERIYLRFDGVYMDSTLYVNRQKVGDWKYGYSAFGFDITDYLAEGENELLMQVRHQSPNSRWYSGAGIYRNVWLQVYPVTYLPLDGTYVHTEYADGSYTLEAETEIAGAVSGSVKLAYYLFPKKWDGTSAERKFLGLGALTTAADGSCKGSLTVTISDVKEWNLEAPESYVLQMVLHTGAAAEELTEDGSCSLPAIDTQETVVGFRHFTFDTNEGFFLNDKYVKLHGVCEHHDLGCLGSAFHKEAMRRKFTKLKQLGVNSLRTSHNMPAAEVMELADEMGILVLSEAFDMWERSKTTYDYGRFFKEWSGRDVASWVRRDRNHPSLLMWSIGNEIYDTHADEHGQEITRYLIDYVRTHDPKCNARVTIGSNYMPWEGAQKCADITKMAGYNYGEKCYEQHHAEHPDWVIYGSETASIVMSRGFYRFPLSQMFLSDEDMQCSSLGNSNTSWGAMNAEACIGDDRDAKFCLGQYLWTGFDYIGEPTPYHTKNSYFGFIDTAGFPKDAAYLLQAEWTTPEVKPMVHLYPYWDFNPGQVIDVRACSNGAAIELFVNGKSYGKQTINHKTGRQMQADWQVVYEPGELVAVAYDEAGMELARDVRHSFGDGVKIVLEADKEVLKGDGEDLCFITISVEDKDGYPVDNAMDYVTLTLEGDGRLLGMDNGDSSDYDQYKCNHRKLFNGKLLAVIGSKILAAGQEEGSIAVCVEGEGLEKAALTLKVDKAQAAEGICCSEEVPAKPDGKSPLGQTLKAGISAALTPDPSAVPVRKIEIRAAEGMVLDPQHNRIPVEAQIYPAHATDRDLIWKIVNKKGIPVDFATLELMPMENGIQKAYVTAKGDGAFCVRLMTKSGTDQVRIISQLEFEAVDLGQATLNPYEFVSAGLFTDTMGETGNGNEKGVSTDRQGYSAVIYDAIDFGDFGSDEITIPIFDLDNKPFTFEIWQGRPQEGELLCTAYYDKPSIWNVYQEDTWKLSKRLKGLQTISFRTLDKKIHIKGFTFTRYEKALCKLWAAEKDNIYGDTFTVEEKAITGIGNNVSVIYEGMDFGQQGVNSITLWSRSPLPGNTMHLHFITDEGETVTRILEVKGQEEYAPQTISIEPLTGKGRIEFIFLPGTNLDLEAFLFA